MAQTQNLDKAQTVGQLIDNSQKEKLLIQIKEWQDQKSLAQKLSELEENNKLFINYFVFFAKKLFKIDQINLLKLNQEQLVELGNIIDYHIKLRALLQTIFKPLCLCIPFLGCSLYKLSCKCCTKEEKPTKSYFFHRFYLKLKRAYGNKDYLPYEHLQNYIQQNDLDYNKKGGNHDKYADAD